MYISLCPISNRVQLISLNMDRKSHNITKKCLKENTQKESYAHTSFTGETFVFGVNIYARFCITSQSSKARSLQLIFLACMTSQSIYWENLKKLKENSSILILLMKIVRNLLNIASNELTILLQDDLELIAFSQTKQDAPDVSFVQFCCISWFKSARQPRIVSPSD